MTMIASTTEVARRVPAWMTWVPRLALGWAVTYGAVRVWFATGHPPTWKLPYDLLTVLPGLGIPFDVSALFSRLGGLTGALLLGGTALAHGRQLNPDCLRCSRTKPWVEVPSTPRWALLGAWVAVAGCVTRIVAQA